MPRRPNPKFDDNFLNDPRCAGPAGFLTWLNAVQLAVEDFNVSPQNSLHLSDTFAELSPNCPLNAVYKKVGVLEMIDWLVLAGVIAIAAAISCLERG